MADTHFKSSAASHQVSKQIAVDHVHRVDIERVLLAPVRELEVAVRIEVNVANVFENVFIERLEFVFGVEVPFQNMLVVRGKMSVLSQQLVDALFVAVAVPNVHTFDEPRHRMAFTDRFALRLKHAVPEQVGQQLCRWTPSSEC